MPLLLTDEGWYFNFWLLPSLRLKISLGIDWVSLSFVLEAADIRFLKDFIAARNASDVPVMAKIENPQAIAIKFILLINKSMMVLNLGDQNNRSC